MNGTNWLRVSYWAAAIADFVIAGLVLIPDLAGLESFAIPQGLMAVTAFSWGVLLIFADRQPLERRWVLVPTMLVIALLGLVMLLALLAGTIPTLVALLGVMTGVLMFSLLAFSYRSSR